MNDNDRIMQRLDELQDQIDRLKEFIKNNSVSYEDMEFDEEIYTESANNKSTLVYYMSTVFEHLLKLKYCTTNWSHSEWIKTISTKMDCITDILDYPWKPDKNYMKFININLGSCYERAVSRYHHLAKNYSDLAHNSSYIPDDLPWSLNDVLDTPLESLLLTLPDPDELTVQMQLCSFCRYDHRLDQIRGRTCTQCQYYDCCIDTYNTAKQEVQ